jgi:hypothetical protein
MRLPMRLVTYDRGGQRRLGAILDGEVVDLPDAVGHPAFPATLEGLVSSSRGTVLDAAQEALARDDVWNWRVRRPTILTPVFPGALISPGAPEADRMIVGPEGSFAWPAGAAWVDHEPELAAIVGKETAAANVVTVREAIFGYTLVADFRARDASGAPVASGSPLPLAIGPCVVTADELDPQAIRLELRVDDQEVAAGTLNGVAKNLFELVATSSQHAPLARGDMVALGPFEDPEDRDPRRRLWPGAVVELAAEGIGTLRTTVGTAASATG